MSETIQSEQCVVCDKFCGQAFLFRARDYLYGIPGEWDIVQCLGCGVVRINPILSSEELTKLYPKNYYAFSDEGDRLKHLFKRFFTPSLIVTEVKFKVPGRVLDYGCGNGKHMIHLRNAGWTCIGVEPNKDAVDYGRGKYGLDILHGSSFALNKIPSDSIDYIRANHSLEHDPDINNTLSEFSRLLRVNGRLLVGIPNIGGVNYKLFKKYWWYMCAPVHVFHFTTENFGMLANRFGFEIEAIRYKGNFTGSLLSLIIFINKNNAQVSIGKSEYLKLIPVIIIFQIFAGIQNFFRMGDAVEIVLKKKMET